MAVARLTLTDFRSYASALVEPGPDLNILTGDNGAGKTNILEALSLLAPGRGLRGAPLGEMARTGGSGNFAVVADVSESRIGVGTQPGTPERRIVRIDGANASASSLAERVAIVWITPAMDRLFTDSAGERRRFLDRLVLALEPGHARESARYEAAMRQRNRLLAADTPADTSWLDALELQMAGHGDAIMAARHRLIAALSTVIAATSIGPFARAQIAIEGWQADGDYAQHLSRARAGDAAAGRTREGPHRIDFAVIHADKQQPAARCSTGEQKALLLGIVLSHADLVSEKRGFRPVLLLDEVAAHLDATRRAALLARIGDSGGQAWLTGTDAMLFAEAPANSCHFRVTPGTISPG
jgi:DNA replication and repair protein RecF